MKLAQYSIMSLYIICKDGIFENNLVVDGVFLTKDSFTVSTYYIHCLFDTYDERLTMY